MKPHIYAGSLPDFCATRERLGAEKTVLRAFPKEVSENQDAAFSYQKLVPSSADAKLEARNEQSIWIVNQNKTTPFAII